MSRQFTEKTSKTETHQQQSGNSVGLLVHPEVDLAGGGDLSVGRGEQHGSAQRLGGRGVHKHVHAGPCGVVLRGAGHT